MKLRSATFAVALVPALLLAGCGSDDTDGGFIPDTTAPLAPVIMGVRADDGIVGLWWNPNTEPDLTGYHVYVAMNGVVRRTTFRPVVDNRYTVNLGPQGSASVYVTAIDYSGNESSPSAWRTVSLSPADGIDGVGGQKFLDDGLLN
jgi:hypothetical protein